MLTRLCLTCLLLGVFTQPALSATLKAGDQAPDFTLTDTEGKSFTLSSRLKQGHVMLVFWELECVYCFSHIKDFNALQKKYQGRLEIAGINFLGEYADDVAKYKKDNNVQYTLLAERLNNIDVAEAYKIIGSPTIVLVAPDRTILFFGYKLPQLEDYIK